MSETSHGMPGMLFRKEGRDRLKAALGRAWQSSRTYAAGGVGEPLWMRAMLLTSRGKQRRFQQAQYFLMPDEGEMTVGERKALHALVMANPDRGTLIEIGTLFGATAFIFALAKNDEQELLCVDCFAWNQFRLRPQDHAAITRRIVGRLGSSVKLVEKTGFDFYETYQGSPPVIAFYDAMHDYPSTIEFIRWAQSVKAQVICGHDYSPKFPGVIQAVDEAGGARQLTESFWVL
jgi:hypothetical protein